MSGGDIGLIGTGTMGAMLALNIAENGFSVSAFDRNPDSVRRVVDTAGTLASRIEPYEGLDAFVRSLGKPRAIILMVPAGPPVDDLIAALSPLLDPNDVVIDAGNANFHDTQRRAEAARAAGLAYLGVGVSGGASGARHGPAIMAGGDRGAWDRVAPILKVIAATFENEPCADWVGPDGAGHFVKTVHNGIEYADMQLIAETYGLLRDGFGMKPSEIAEVFRRWNDGPLKSYLIEITSKIAATEDPETARPILDIILDTAGQKGTGRWTLIEAQHLGVAMTVVEAAVAARNLSAELPLRQKAGERFPGGDQRIEADRTPSIVMLEKALIAAKIICYAQGFALLARASVHFEWDLPLPRIARNWRAGCIIRSAMLSDMADALNVSPETNLLVAPGFAARVAEGADPLRQAVMAALAHAIPLPAHSAAIAYFDTVRAARTTANMIQGQRDFFGEHGFERTDRPGTGFHGPWTMAR